MTEKTVWQCDGCGKETVYREDSDRGWRKINIKIDGFKGYPIGDWANIDRSYHLCTACQSHLRDSALPDAWPRVQESGK